MGTSKTPRHANNMPTQRLSADALGIAEAVDLLRSGANVAFPTETVYGLGGDACNPHSIAGIYSAKGRPSNNPLIVHVADEAMIAGFAEFPEVARTLARAFWPGPLTLLLPRQGHALAAAVTAGHDTVAVRIPAHPLAQGLLRQFGGPIAAPSANPSGAVSPTSADHVLDGLDGRVAAVIDGGSCEVGLESTIVSFQHGQVTVLRPGGITLEAIEDETRMAPHVIATPALEPVAPGQFASHYAPRSAVRLNVDFPDEGEVWLGFGAIASGLKPQLNLSPDGDLEEAARNLFDYLRRLDFEAGEVGRIAVAPIPHTGLGLALNDRLRRAAAPRGR